MWNRPEWDPYDVIVKLDEAYGRHNGQILELAKSQNAQAKQISMLIANQNVIRNEIIELRQQLAQTMQLQIDALAKMEILAKKDDKPTV